MYQKVLENNANANENQFLVQKFQELLNSPSKLNNQKSIEQLRDAVHQICKKQLNLVLKPNGRSQCAFCNESIDENALQVPQQSSQVILFKCCYSPIHKRCLKQQSLELTKQLNEDILFYQNQCKYCKTLIQINDVKLAFGREYDTIQAEQIKKIAEEYAEKDKSERLSQQKAATFECIICSKKKLLSERVTLSCSQQIGGEDHYLCAVCLTEHTLTAISSAKLNPHAVGCPIPGCQQLIDFEIVQQYTPKQILDEQLRAEQDQIPIQLQVLIQQLSNRQQEIVEDVEDNDII